MSGQGQAPATPRTAYETCYGCLGAGLQDGIDGPVDCWTCGGDTVVRARDSKGRFTTVPIDSELARRAGSIGGKISKRGVSKPVDSIPEAPKKKFMRWGF